MTEQPVRNQVRTDIVTLTLEFKTERLKKELESLCNTVLSAFRLPAYRLLCCFDDENTQWQQSNPGVYGIQTSVIGSGDALTPWVKSYLIGLDGEFAFDNVIYVPGTVYSAQPVSFTLIFAHELQHFVQNCQHKKEYDASSLLKQHFASFGHPDDFRVWDFPHERDAMMISKQIAEKVFGEQTVSAFIANEAKTLDCKKKELWNFYRDLHPSGFDFLTETRRMVENYRPRLLSLEESSRETLSVDFSVSEWWK